MSQVKRGVSPLSLFKQGKLIIFGVILAIVCFAVGFFSGGREEKPPVLSSITVENQLQQISQLATIRYSYTNMGQFENSNEFYGIKLPFTTKSFIVAYDGTITAGVDLTQAKVTVTDQKVTIALPAPQILSHEVDPNSLEVFDETTSIFNPITIEDYTGFQADQQGVMEEKAIQGGLLTQAKDQAEAAIGGLITPLLQEGQTLEITVADGE
ncbi:DUF4230 domain-containing protein [Pseudoflavonifractor phocaeensis]|uniref:DUF4230 domain-containing protein n=1 Tax=Pseudoflavonifractor phocaeensis TaxID=1870988 RepID=UPI0025A33424|nr:DUF4230 domain-containing protein [Pseudoflavonifractor phocaeensis]MDM8239118.1 DUF4230 domain-containing protein [Pseudoflavonifractor phocaeensis]